MKKIIVVILTFLLLLPVSISAKELNSTEFYYSNQYNVGFIIEYYSDNTATAKLTNAHSPQPGGVLNDNQSAMASWAVAQWWEKDTPGYQLCYKSNSFGVNEVKFTENCTGIILEKSNIDNFLTCSYNIDISGNNSTSEDVSFKVYEFDQNVLTILNNDFSKYGIDNLDATVSVSNASNLVSARFMYKYGFIDNFKNTTSCPNLGYNQSYGIFNIDLKSSEYSGAIYQASEGNQEQENGKYTNYLPSNNYDDYRFYVEKKENQLCLTLSYGDNKKSDPECYHAEKSADWSFIGINGLNHELTLTIYQSDFNAIVNNFEKPIYVNFDTNYSNGITKVNYYLSHSLEENEYYTDQSTDEEEELKSNLKFKGLISNLKRPLSYTNFSYTNNSGKLGSLSYLADISLNINTNQLCSDNSTSSTYCASEKNLSYYIEQGVQDVVTYCNNTVFEAAGKNPNDAFALERLAECKDFITHFYPQLIEQGIINDLGSDCGFMSQDLLEFIQYFLNLLAIIAPILAIGLGILDFIKVIANGDADKEMKNAGKNFLIRVGVAMLLLIVPLIIAFILNTFGDVITGYNSDDPFCGLEVGLE